MSWKTRLYKAPSGEPRKEISLRAPGKEFIWSHTNRGPNRGIVGFLLVFSFGVFLVLFCAFVNFWELSENRMNKCIQIFLHEVPSLPLIFFSLGNELIFLSNWIYWLQICLGDINCLLCNVGICHLPCN